MTPTTRLSHAEINRGHCSSCFFVVRVGDGSFIWKLLTGFQPPRRGWVFIYGEAATVYFLFHDNHDLAISATHSLTLTHV